MVAQNNSLQAPVLPNRKAIEDEIERLIDVLDQLDPDPDLEPQCEDEGAQCEDEGARCEDEGAYEGD